MAVAVVVARAAAARVPRYSYRCSPAGVHWVCAVRAVEEMEDANGSPSSLP